MLEEREKNAIMSITIFLAIWTVKNIYYVCVSQPFTRFDRYEPEVGSGTAE